MQKRVLQNCRDSHSMVYNHSVKLPEFEALAYYATPFGNFAVPSNSFCFTAGHITYDMMCVNHDSECVSNKFFCILTASLMWPLCNFVRNCDSQKNRTSQRFR